MVRCLNCQSEHNNKLFCSEKCYTNYNLKKNTTSKKISKSLSKFYKNKHL